MGEKPLPAIHVAELISGLLKELKLNQTRRTNNTTGKRRNKHVSQGPVPVVSKYMRKVFSLPGHRAPRTNAVAGGSPQQHIK